MFLWLSILGAQFIAIYADNSINNGLDVMTRQSIYYDVQSKSPLMAELESSRFPTNSVRFVSRGLPCSCQDLTCGCCAGIDLAVFNFTKTTCMEFVALPEEFAIDMRLIIDGERVFENRLSARNPPPVCVPLYAVPIVSFCVRFFDIRLVESTLSTCLDFETKVAQWPIFILHFDCVRVGGTGISWVRPNATSFALPTIADVEIYDEVAFNPEDIDISNTTSALTPEEDKIGTLKL
ncbi:uncharacterized protein [Fopius arisanus]|uniref:DUF4773 domain-containing protein n=2 Tax=Fopius arisanus TaxID=64838 RepID=A0A9R1TW17_9HYME|nr:PREDICTED: uncharacterized protein LOC105264676 [Fopius arisanus]